MAFLALRRSVLQPWRRFSPPLTIAGVTHSRSLCWRPEGPELGPIVMEATHLDEEKELPNMYHEPVALVTGASRGLGLEFTRQLLTKYPGLVVYGSARKPDQSEGLKALKRRHPVRLEVATMDVTKEETIESIAADSNASIAAPTFDTDQGIKQEKLQITRVHAPAIIAGFHFQALSKEIGEKYGRLDLIINCAGVLHIPGVMEPETLLSKAQPENLMRAFEVNCVGPALIAKHFWELLKIGQGTNTGRCGAVIAHISDRVSSIKDNTLAGWYAYRGSKTALNMLVRTMSLESMSRRDPVLCILLHPGCVNTDLARPFIATAKVPKMKLFTPDYSVERLLGIINKTRPEDNGKFTSWDRQEVNY